MRFSDSSKLMNQFNNEMRSGGVNRTGVYTNGVAYAHNFLFLSQYLINIISPLTVGFVSGDKFELTSDLLKSYYFYFHLDKSFKSID